ncbi:HAMP domain-containing sensor histidine kinase [Opitutus sp. ER46]|uniref:sensor histidine kinase n=1 Tax=Opitutus sp. ER46 TaxID=2161864 RepID=UPI000D30F593|nr:HAMP domain-containing sensor histidine kinase [Opitutus sp. ER46]PTX94427.1 hypothetical protein DB354_11800 [Opitutus sp. ER46]
MKPQHLVIATGVAAVALGVVAALVSQEVLSLEPWLSGAPKPVPTSIGLLGGATGALLLTTARRRGLSLVLALGVALGGASILIALALAGTAADEWVRPWLARVGPVSPHAALGITLLGTALALVAVRRGPSTRIGHVVALAGLTEATFVIMAFVFGARELYSVDGHRGISPLTALITALLSFGVLGVFPQSSLVRVFYISSSGRTRIFLPLVFGAPLVLALAVATGLRSGWYTSEAALALLAVCVMLVLGGVTWAYALTVNGAEARLEWLVKSRTRRLSETVEEVEEFSQALAHDVRGPLINLREFLAMLQDEHAEELSPMARDYVERAGRACRRIDALTQAMLRYGELSRRPFQLGPVQVDALVQAVAAETRRQWSEATITIEGPLAPARADPAGLAEVFRELLANACRFARNGEAPRITISCHEHPASVRYLLRDEGVGVAPRFQERIFHPFEQLVRTGDRAGMGLALVRRAVTKMEGQVGVISDGVAGSVFWLELPGAATSPQNVPG